MPKPRPMEVDALALDSIVLRGLKKHTHTHTHTHKCIHPSILCSHHKGRAGEKRRQERLLALLVQKYKYCCLIPTTTPTTTKTVVTKEEQAKIDAKKGMLNKAAEARCCYCLYYGPIKALSRLYQGSIQALFRLY